MRKLASVQRISELVPIKGADFIETAIIQGWQCIVRKGEFKVGDLGVYLEIDSVPPNTPAFAFLWHPYLEPPGNFRIRTKKLRGVISQGLLMPLNSFPELHYSFYVEGIDVTEHLGVKKYEVPVKAQPGHRTSVAYGPFAAGIPKTDEERIQSSLGLLDEMAGLPYVITEKCDGTSVTFAIDRDGVFRVYSRNWEVAPPKQIGAIETALLNMLWWFGKKVLMKFGPKHGHALRIWVHERLARRESLYWDVATKYKIEEALRTVPWMALQGEICGPNIQKNRLGLSANELRAFTLYNKRFGERCDHHVLASFCDAHNIPRCLVVTSGESFGYTLEQLLKLAEGKYEGTKNEREGIVVRPRGPQLKSRILGGALSFKVVSNRFLLGGGEDD
jgi:RNA ligase (TIGR02306 family)